MNRSLKFLSPLVPVFCMLLLLGACKGCKKEGYKVDVPDKPVEVSLMRFEKEMYSIDTANASQGLQELYHKYGPFYLSYARDILAMPYDEADPLFIRPMTMALKYPPFRHLQHSIDSTFGNLQELKDQLGWAMAVYKQEFPMHRVPKFVTFFSEYSLANVMYDTLFGIGLDMYMNETQLPYYRALEFPEFRIRKLRREYMLPNLIKAIAIARYDDQNSRDRRFLATMILEGKYLFFSKALLPGVNDTLITG
jgi:hypothetical protein